MHTIPLKQGKTPTKFRMKQLKPTGNKSTLIINKKTITLHIYDPKNIGSSPPLSSQFHQTSFDMWGYNKLLEDNFVKNGKFLPNRKMHSLSSKKQMPMSSQQLLQKYLNRKKKKMMRAPLIHQLADRNNTSEAGDSNFIQTIFSKKFVSLSPQTHKQQSTSPSNKVKSSLLFHPLHFQKSGYNSQMKNPNKTFNLTKVDLTSQNETINQMGLNLTERKRKIANRRINRFNQRGNLSSLYRTEYMNFKQQ